MKRQPGTAELASMNLSANMTSGIGQPLRRKEDFRLLTGRGSFADDIHLPELAHAVIVRSPHAGFARK
jgi:carbon-monoxide dehydrogenase large subunit